MHLGLHRGREPRNPSAGSKGSLDEESGCVPVLQYCRSLRGSAGCREASFGRNLPARLHPVLGYLHHPPIVERTRLIGDEIADTCMETPSPKRVHLLAEHLPVEGTHEPHQIATRLEDP
jgi:hypothetical protein